MDVGKWEEEMKKIGILEDNRHILEGFKVGFDQGIPEVPIEGLRFYCPDNHSSAILAKDEIEKNLKGEIVEGRMFGPFTKQEAYQELGFFRSSPLGAVTNGDGTLRPINDLSYPRRDKKIRSVNTGVDKEDFTTS
jgi:hypothetical protein